MKENYICGICGRSYTDLEEYLDCVSRCGKKLKKEREEAESKKRLEELNSAINRVKQAKDYYEGLLKDFKEKYPKEFELNFGNLGSECKKSISTKAKDVSADKPKSIELSYRNDGKNKPEISEKINGKKVDDDVIIDMSKDPEIMTLAKLLGIM